ncbi:MAG TPA: pitrilysin family protein [Myxococcaceae bacterium]|nr:pitrilysin family protein [Myxococcaceae bacterium]
MSPRKTKPGAELFPVHEARLPNGLRVRMVPDHDAPVVSLYTFFQVGSRNERPGITGISHLFEHMMFNGAERYGPKEFDEVLESNGGRSNAYTTHDVTVYYEDFAAEALDTVLDLESDRMRSLTIDDRSLRSEREVVKEERRLRVDNEPAGLMDEALHALAYQSHPYRWPVIGFMGDIEAIRREDCEAYFRTFYAPNNAVLWAAGDFDPDALVRRIRKAYGDIRPGPAAPRVVDAEPAQRGERRAELRHPSRAPSLLIGYRGPAVVHPDTLTLDVLQFILGVGEGSRLQRALVYDKRLAVNVGVDWSWRRDPGLFSFHLELQPDADVRAAEEALYAEIRKLAEEGVEPREVEKARNNLRAHLLREFTSNSGRAHALGTYEMFLGGWKKGFALPEAYGRIDAPAVQASARRWLDPTQRSVVTLVPEEART